MERPASYWPQAARRRYSQVRIFWDYLLSRFHKNMPDKNNLRPRSLAVSLCAALLFLFAVAVSRPFSGLRGQATAPARDESRRASDAATQPSSAFTVSNSPSAIELGRNIESKIDESAFARARWGVF